MKLLLIFSLLTAVPAWPQSEEVESEEIQEEEEVFDEWEREEAKARREEEKYRAQALKEARGEVEEEREEAESAGHQQFVRPPLQVECVCPEVNVQLEEETPQIFPETSDQFVDPTKRYED